MIEIRNSPNPKLTMFKSILWIIVLLFPFVGLGQGAWNIGQIDVDSLSDSFIGKEIRINFKSQKELMISTPSPIKWARSFERSEDTVKLKLSLGEIAFKENWRTWCDHGVLNEQSLISIGKGTKWIIGSMQLQGITSDAILVTAQLNEIKTRGKFSNQLEESISIKKDLIRSILYDSD